MASLFWLSDKAWVAIEPHLPHGEPGKPRVDDRTVISGSLYQPASGKPGAVHISFDDVLQHLLVEWQVRDDLHQTRVLLLKLPQEVKRGDKVVALSTQEIILENLAGKAAGGDTKSVGLMLQAIGKYLADEVGVQDNGELDLQEANILNIALERLVQRHTAPDEREGPSDPKTVTAPPSMEPAPPAEPVIERDEPIVKQPRPPSVLDKLRNRK